MSDSSLPQSAPAEQLFAAGQAFARQILDLLSKQQAWAQAGAHPPQSAPALLPDTEKLAGLQQDLIARHTQLWSDMLKRDASGPSPSVARPAPGDRRFSSPEWSNSPYFDYLRQAYLINAEYVSRLAESLPIADARTKSRVQFLTRQVVDAMAPSNFAATNPEFVQAALESNGESITRGIQNLIADLEKGRISMTDDAAFEVGRNLAVTPGAVVYENQLMQLIQYAPTTKTVAQRPLLIIPPCINKYYILDLQPHNSFVRYAVEQGNTVFLVSWKNPGAEESRCTWDDYLELGPLAALKVVRAITRVAKPNVLGFCVGGTLLTSAIAVLKARGEDPVASVTLLTTLLDYSEPGELGCLVDEASMAARDATLGQGGLLSGREMSQVFSSLRANDLIWQYVVGNYLKGQKPAAFDLLYWNSDSTNLPGPFLTYYLRTMYLNNDLRVPERLEMLGEKIDLSAIDAPAYVVAAREDHIVPWQSAYLTRQLLSGETEFVLGAAGHIAGVINPASSKKRSFWTSDSLAPEIEEWLTKSTENPGSWWPHWSAWLAKHSDKQIRARATLGTKAYPVIEAAPGRYVRQRS